MIRDSSFWLEERAKPNKTLGNFSRSGDYVRALCILLLIAKYCGPDPRNPKAKIQFKEILDRHSWLKSFGTSFSQDSTKNKLIHDCFEDLNFLKVTKSATYIKGRKNKGMLPRATYNPSVLPLENVSFYKFVSSEAGTVKVLLEGEQLRMMAKALDEFEISDPKGWRRSVDDHVRVLSYVNEENDGELTSGNKPPTTAQLGFTLSAQCRELFLRANHRARAGIRGGQWYVITGTPIWFPEWRELFCEAAEIHGAIIKCAFNGPSSVKRCPTIAAQWQMHTGHRRVDNILGHLETRERELRDELLSWSHSDPDKKSKRLSLLKKSFSFYESGIAHPFIAVLSVPPSSEKSLVSRSSAPAGTWCALGLDAFFFSDFDERCGLFLETPNPVLNTYYKSILSFFDERANKFLMKSELLKGM